MEAEKGLCFAFTVGEDSAIPFILFLLVSKCVVIEFTVAIPVVTQTAAAFFILFIISYFVHVPLREVETETSRYKNVLCEIRTIR